MQTSDDRLIGISVEFESSQHLVSQTASESGPTGGASWLLWLCRVNYDNVHLFSAKWNPRLQAVERMMCFWSFVSSFMTIAFTYDPSGDLLSSACCRSLAPIDIAYRSGRNNQPISSYISCLLMASDKLLQEAVQLEPPWNLLRLFFK